MGRRLLSRGPDAPRPGRPTTPRHPGSRVVAFTFRALLDHFRGARSPTLTTDQRTARIFALASSSHRVNPHLLRQPLDPQRHAFLSNSRAASKPLARSTTRILTVRGST